MEWEKYSQTMSDKEELTAKIYKELHTTQQHKTNNPIKNGQKI